MEENFSMEWNMEWKIFSTEWKKIASMEYGKFVFHSIPYHALLKGYYHVMFQACLRHNYVPSPWKEGTGIFFPKPGKESYFEAKSFRMITLTSFQLKCLERLISVSYE